MRNKLSTKIRRHKGSSQGDGARSGSGNGRRPLTKGYAVIVAESTGNVGFDLLLFSSWASSRASQSPSAPRRYRDRAAQAQPKRRAFAACVQRRRRATAASPPRACRAGAASLPRARRVGGAYPAPSRRLAAANPPLRRENPQTCQLRQSRGSGISTVDPCVSPASSWRCASAASSSAKRWPISGRSAPVAISSNSRAAPSARSSGVA